MRLDQQPAHSRRQSDNAGFCKALPAVLLVLVASCSGAPTHQVHSGNAGPPVPSRQEIVRCAKTFVGTPYRAGGASRKGVDCSGFVFAVYNEFDIRLPRTSLDQSRVGEQIDRAGLKPADLLFFRTSRRSSISHVGIYIGGGKFVHASTNDRRVRVDALSDDYYKRRFTVARRIVDG